MPAAAATGGCVGVGGWVAEACGAKMRITGVLLWMQHACVALGLTASRTEPITQAGWSCPPGRLETPRASLCSVPPSALACPALPWPAVVCRPGPPCPGQQCVIAPPRPAPPRSPSWTVCLTRATCSRARSTRSCWTTLRVSRPPRPAERAELQLAGAALEALQCGAGKGEAGQAHRHTLESTAEPEWRPARRQGFLSKTKAELRGDLLGVAPSPCRAE